MSVPMVRIRKMQVEVRHRKMDMPMGVGFTIRTKFTVRVLMMGAMCVGVFMIHLLV